jgi:hypothetical protein
MIELYEKSVRHLLKKTVVLAGYKAILVEESKLVGIRLPLDQILGMIF